MYIEFAAYDEIVISKIQSDIFKAMEIGASGISLPLSILPSAKQTHVEGMIFSCPIDYPTGLSDTNTRMNQVVRASHFGANTVDIVCNLYLFYNKRELFTQDIKSLVNTCKEKKLTLRFMIDYRKLIEAQDFLRVLHVLMDHPIDYIIPSTGMFNDEPTDNILHCISAQRKCGFRAIANGNFFTQEDIKIAAKSNIYGMRFSNINSMERKIVGV